MPVFVDQIASVPQVSPAALRSLKANPSVVLQTGTTCTLDAASPKTPHYLRTLGLLWQGRMPVYLETDPNTNLVSRLLVPRVFQVESVVAAPTGDRVLVRFQISHAIHFLRTANPNFQALLTALQTANQHKTAVLVTEEPDRPEIIDVRLANTPLAPAMAPPVTPYAPAAVPAAVVALVPADAQAMFDLVNAQTCSTNASVSTCIPFLYPDDGCWARANEMCRLMIGSGVTPMKVWLYGTLLVDTKNSPVCHVDWGWHVAPVLLVDTGRSSEQYVIDPSLFSGPALLSDWIAIQHTTVPPSDSEVTDASVYRTARLTGGASQYDPGYAMTNADLNHYRIVFGNRCTVDNPPGPPYPCP